MIEFTGERVVPGQVDADLWNEHLARYAFAARLSRGRAVLDAGCGSGYGSDELARSARTVFALDVSHDAVAHARETYGSGTLHFLQATCAALPLRSGTIELAVAYEVIEHIHDWRAFLEELRRVLAPRGQLVISTPNRDYYADTRRQTGPNPYHVHEFAFDEFASELGRLFPNVTMYTQNHVEGIAFQPAGAPGGSRAAIELRALERPADAANAHFFVAVCSVEALPAPAPFLFLPSTANVLREREVHIEKLEVDLAGLRSEKQNLVEMFREQKGKLEESNRWGNELDEKLEASGRRIVELQDEAAAMRAGYEAKIAELEEENERKTAWALGLQRQLDVVHASRWVKLGNRIGVGPALEP